MRPPTTNEDAASLALRALAWTLGDPTRADRLLALTGLTPDDLRGRAGDPTLLASVLGFLEAYEPDLMACADSIGVSPKNIVAAREALER